MSVRAAGACASRESGEEKSYRNSSSHRIMTKQILTTNHCANELPEDSWVTESTKTEGESVGGGGERVGVANFLCCIHFRL